MTTVTVDYLENTIEIKGHTLDPVVCHALSGLIDSVSMWLEKKVNARVIMDDDAYCKIMPPDKCNHKDFLYYVEFLQFLTDSIIQIDDNNPCNIEIKVK